MAVMEAIKTVYMEADASSLTISGIPATYEHLQVRGSMRSTNNTAGIDMYMVLNAATGSQWSQKMYFTGTSESGLASGADGYIIFGDSTGTSNEAKFYPTFVIDIHDYAATDKDKTVMYQCGKSVLSSEALILGGGAWADTAALTSIKFYFASGDIQRGSVFSLYGFKEA